jgi:hypothetical protein
MSGERPFSEIIPLRFSCRTYLGASVPEADRARLEQKARWLTTGPLGTPLRFRLMAATEGDANALKGLGTYGFIRGASAFLVGAVSPGERYL